MTENKITKDRLALYLRNDFDTKIRPIFIKERCEHCGQEAELHLHHNNKYFSTLLNETLTELNLSSTEEFTNEQARIIKYIMRGKQLSIDYLTLCKECHTEIHKRDYEKNESKFRCKPNKEYIMQILDTLIEKPLYKEEKQKLIDSLSITDNRGRENKSIGKINLYLKEIGLHYKIISKRERQGGNRVSYWIIIKDIDK